MYAAFVIDFYSRMIVGWALSTSLRTDLALDALDMAIWLREERLDGLVHHTDRAQYTSIRYTERLAGVHAVASVGSRGDSYDCEHDPPAGRSRKRHWPALAVAI